MSGPNIYHYFCSRDDLVTALIIDAYDDLADTLEAAPEGLPPAAYGIPVYHLYVVQTPDRKKLQSVLDAANISYGIHYPVPIHLQPAFADLGLKPGIAIAVGAFDAHMGAVGAGIREGTLVKILGTSSCDMMVAPADASRTRPR